ncbi:MAG: hypothetical protein WC343_06865 [Bacilli bacterium]
MPALDEKPALYPDLQLDYEAFWFLSDSRRFTMGGAGPIPISEIHHYAEMFRIPLAQRMSFLRKIKAMDRAYLKFSQSKPDEESSGRKHNLH